MQNTFSLAPSSTHTHSHSYVKPERTIQYSYCTCISTIKYAVRCMLYFTICIAYVFPFLMRQPRMLKIILITFLNPFKRPLARDFKFTIYLFLFFLTYTFTQLAFVTIYPVQFTYRGYNKSPTGFSCGGQRRRLRCRWLCIGIQAFMPTAVEQPLQILVIARGRHIANAALVLEFIVKAQPPTARRKSLASVPKKSS